MPSLPSLAHDPAPKLPTLTPKQIQHYQEKGYLILPQAQHHLFPSLQSFKSWIHEVSVWPSPPDPTKPESYRLYYEPSPVPGEDPLLFDTERVSESHQPLANIITGPAAISLLHQLTGQQMLLFKDEVAWKLPGGRGAIPHIDLPAYGDFAPEFVEIMIAVDAHTAENGCMEVVDGSHREEVPFGEGGRIVGDWVQKLEGQGREFVPVVLEAGDILIFGEKLAHRLGPNKTDQRRAAVFATYHFDLEKPDLRDEFFAHRLVFD
ncbi:Phytanoyl-CoA dioxygenase [Penicillium expansum]|uniref:Phytanoyl-CoA dioxygenase n=1 Tax=Penicillium expansum TaxID=27334 RepID=A0A0A2IXY0_PENEN|nr:Phytanoyl-CoA dioxygenase [Penicillium expansum]KGO43220.1 Phytanoyl-CoA dioxygenase [Penicillium expansum]KGO47962.1 Phytanoyl-CoA dioxygenase [Penicillium expansum]KGO52400.1 Phytanoyl-CoA dioxygenase [Penicillium expansum]